MENDRKVKKTSRLQSRKRMADPENTKQAREKKARYELLMKYYL